MYRSVLVPLDGSTFGEHALPLAVSVAARTGGRLLLAHVHQPIASVYSGNELVCDYTLDAALRDNEQAYLEEVRKRLAEVAHVPTAADLVDGPVAEALLEKALTDGADLLVLATHGRGPLSRLWLGSVADQLIRRSPLPVLLTRPQDEAADLKAASGFRRILIPLDGSTDAEQVLPPALALGNLTGAEYLLCRVIEPALLPGPHRGRNFLDDLDPVLLRKLQEGAQAYLDRVAERLRSQSTKVETRVAVNPSAVVAILETARANAVDLIALETHGRGGLSRLVLGSVADKVVRGASTPVLVHRPLAQ